MIQHLKRALCLVCHQRVEITLSVRPFAVIRIHMFNGSRCQGSLTEAK